MSAIFLILNNTLLREIFREVGEDEFLILNKPNMLGLLISYDSYKNEIIDNVWYAKDGDTGCSICGGDELIYVLPCYTAFIVIRHIRMKYYQKSITVIGELFECHNRLYIGGYRIC